MRPAIAPHRVPVFPGCPSLAASALFRKVAARSERAVVNRRFFAPIGGSPGRWETCSTEKPWSGSRVVSSTARSGVRFIRDRLSAWCCRCCSRLSTPCPTVIASNVGVIALARSAALYDRACVHSECAARQAAPAAERKGVGELGLYIALRSDAIEQGTWWVTRESNPENTHYRFCVGETSAI